MSYGEILILWFLTLLLGPVIFVGLEILISFDADGLDLCELYPLTVVFSMIFSLPALAVLLIVKAVLSKSKKSDLSKKIFVLASAITSVVLTLMLPGGISTPVLYLVLAYVCAILVTAGFMELVGLFGNWYMRTVYRS